jgi:hypothetical protein
VPHTSVVAAEDRLVVGNETACLGVGDVIVLEKRGHNALLFDEEVAGLVIDRVRQARPRQEAHETRADSVEAPKEASERDAAQ